MKETKIGDLKSVFILMIGTVFAQLIPVMLQPLLRRQYSPEDFGEFVIFSAITEVLVTIASLRYEQAILVPKAEAEAKELFKLSILICFFFNIVILLFSLIISVLKIDFLLPNGLTYISLIAIPFGTFFFSIINTGSYWYTRIGEYKSLSINKLYRRLTEGITQVGLGFFSSSIGLITGMLTGLFFGGIHIFYKTKIQKSLFESIDLKYFKKLFIKHKSFVKYGVLPSLLNILSIFLPVFIISNKFSTNLIGQFDLSRQILALPLVIISGSISQVLITKVMKKHHENENFMVDLKVTFLLMSTIALLIIICFYWVGECIIIYVFGQEWSVAGSLSRILVIGYGFKFVNTCFYNILIPLNKVKVLGWWQVLNFLVSLCLIFPLFSKDIETFSLSYTVVEIVSNLVCLVLVFSTARKVIEESKNNSL